ncbi:rhomboid family [Fusarium albosuccineum]|uniref:Rhomboid family n=1 Tax=Fusarium albosuccineum TaxID=1237068 RepID=A0A8H4LKX6_9HYPO|nr:rhomboid family [Fusarium albosuccineum]
MDTHDLFGSSPGGLWVPHQNFDQQYGLGDQFNSIPTDMEMSDMPLLGLASMNHIAGFICPTTDGNQQFGAMGQGFDNPEAFTAPSTRFPNSANTGQTTTVNPRKRSKYSHLNWDVHKAELKRLYLDEDKPLPETMKIMKDEHGFEASTKLYKEKFKQWDWNKKLPVPIAQFMANRAQSRKMDNGRDTVFTYGGKVWDKYRAENTLSRSTKPRAQEPISDMTTPAGVVVLTPANHAPEVDDDVSEEQNDRESVIEATDDVDMDDGLSLRLSWHGYTRTQLLSMRKEGSNLIQQGKLEDARALLTEVSEGFCHLQGAFHEETKKVVYELANLHTQMGDEREADHVLEKLTQAHIEGLGFKHKKTQSHILHVVELLNGWGRPDDALGLLSLSKETDQCLNADKEPGSRRSRNRGRRRRRRAKATNSHHDEADRMGIVVLDDEIPADAEPSHIDYQLDLAHSQVVTKDANVEPLLRALISHCENHQGGLITQNLRARGDLLSLYEKLDVVADHVAVFEDTVIALNNIWESYDWDEERFECIDVMEAYMQVVANMLKSGFTAQAKAQFRKVANKAEGLFSRHDERAVWINITIGLAFQTHMNWDEAEEWFDRAYAGALCNDEWGPKDGIVKSLENARKNHYFSYISDEGRPFKTIFGISGITIRPGRLHLE